MLHSTVCDDKQKWNNNKCRCECSKIENCEDGYFWNVINCKCEEGRNALKLIEECDEIVDDTEIIQNKTIVAKYLENCNHLLLHLFYLFQLQ